VRPIHCVQIGPICAQLSGKITNGTAGQNGGYAGAGRSQQVVTECVGCFGLSGPIAGCEWLKLCRPQIICRAEGLDPIAVAWTR
jgi:hypothetical protein